MCDPCFMDAKLVGIVHELTWDGDQDHARQRHHHQAAEQMRELSSSRGENTCLPLLFRRSSLRPQGRLQLQSRPPPPVSSSPSRRSSPRQRPKPVCAAPTSSSTASATPPTLHCKVGNAFDVLNSRPVGQPARGRRRHRPRHHHHQRHQQRAGRLHHPVRARQPEEGINFLVVQPVSFTGRDEAVSDERQPPSATPWSYMAHDVKNQTGLGEPTRDWFPISFMPYLLRPKPTCPRTGSRLGPALLRLSPPTAASVMQCS